MKLRGARGSRGGLASRGYRRCLWGALLTLALEGPAWAAPSAADQAAAQALFDAGKSLVSARQYADACPKFAESQRLDPRVATEFKLADCYEHVGRTASAWVSFLNVASATKAAHDSQREMVARARAAALEPKLSRLTIRVDAANVPGLVVRRDGEEVGSGQWGTPLPLDPGDHSVEASAPGKVTWRGSVTVGPVAAAATIVVPSLADAPVGAVVPVVPIDAEGAPPSGRGPDAPPPPNGGQGQRVAGIVIASAGLVTVGVGAGFGVQAIAKHNDAAPFCPSASLCKQPGLDFTNQAKSAATISTATFIAGGAALALGAVLFFTAPTGRTAAPAIGAAPLVGPGFGGGTLRGSW